MTRMPIRRCSLKAQTVRSLITRQAKTLIRPRTQPAGRLTTPVVIESSRLRDNNETVKTASSAPAQLETIVVPRVRTTGE